MSQNATAAGGGLVGAGRSASMPAAGKPDGRLALTRWLALAMAVVVAVASPARAAGLQQLLGTCTGIYSGSRANGVIQFVFSVDGQRAVVRAVGSDEMASPAYRAMLHQLLRGQPLSPLATTLRLVNAGVFRAVPESGVLANGLSPYAERFTEATGLVIPKPFQYDFVLGTYPTKFYLSLSTVETNWVRFVAYSGTSTSVGAVDCRQ
jgi:hypothetical protein